MITSRGWWFLLIVLCLVTLGLFGDHWTVALLGLTLLLWFLGEWFMFALRMRLVVPTLVPRRTLHDDRGPVDTLWAGHSFQVRVETQTPHWLGLPYAKIADRVPFGVERGQGTAECEVELNPDQAQALAYGIRCTAAGKVRFEGLSIQLADFQGFFHHTTFVPAPVVYRVLPPLADAEGHRPTVKRHNLLPSPGLHRHLRPGSGSELLDLRDYLPGDPPKTIAWKVSARRDRLITKEFESEVPLRCTLFVDTSHSVRVGLSGKNALARLVDISAAVTQATAAARDLTGMCLFDEKTVSAYVRPARGARHLVGLLNLLADAAGLAPATGQARLRTLVPLAHAFAQEVYPDLLRPEVNRVPAWLPLLWPGSSNEASPRTWGRRLLHGWLVAVAFLPLAVLALLFYLLGDLFYPLAGLFFPLPDVMLAILAGGLTASVLILYYTVVNRAGHALGLLFEKRRRLVARWRKQLAAIVSERYGLAPGGLGVLLEDDESFALYVQRFLADHQVPYPLPFYDRRGHYLFASPGKVEVLARALIRAVGKGHDNELFVLLVDLLELTDHLEPLLRAVKVTLARHHQVVVICPWPPGVPPPGRHAPADKPEVRAADVQAAVYQATMDRLHQAYQQLRQTFARMGVVVVCADSGDPVRLILERINRLRYLGLGRRR
jgi:uncharacterized protein (DUF58 family)